MENINKNKAEIIEDQIINDDINVIINEMNQSDCTTEDDVEMLNDEEELNKFDEDVDVDDAIEIGNIYAEYLKQRRAA